ncbi:cardiolipin synthase [Aquipuribacter sp. MA13-6]|uniref:cardiolipin synthase n=1 Tax=unclassified Aquipuribacter TaxID=2635084 RepID=UPI003EEE0065
MEELYVVASGVVAVGFGLVALVTALVVVPRDRRPSSATAWIVVIVFVPVVGVLAFFFIGNPRLPAARRIKQRSIDRLINERTREYGLGVQQAPGPPWLDQVVRLNRRTGALPMLQGNSAFVETGYESSLQAIAADIDSAQDFVHVEFYILAHDPTTAPVFEAMARAVRRGVTVRVLLDHIGSWGSPGYRRTLRELTATGAQWHLMLPVQPLRGRYQRPDLRNHRKIVVVDGTVGWAGSQNLVDASYNKLANRRRGLRWQDLMVRLRGPVVQELEALFVTDWFSETDELLEVGTPEPDAAAHGDLHIQVVPSGPGFETENNLNLFNSLMYGAQERISITSPYFVPDESLLYAVTAAGLRGVDVELFVPEQADQFVVHHAQRSYYEQLLRAGIRIYLYPAPYVLHAKHVGVDSDISVVGSSNLDIRSFTLDLECTLLIHGQGFSEQLREVEDGYRAVSRELTLPDWLARPRWQKVTDNLARLTSALQ